MRRKTTALTRTIAGAALAASAAVVIPAWAQQSPQPAASGRNQAATAPESAATVAPASAQPPAATPSEKLPPPTPISDAKAVAEAQANTVYGVGVTRGARYLVRNGLDYIEYQEYDRALKYLREAETRQAELTAAEKTMLKQGIEKAQRGLREAVGAKTPYAASKKARRAGGFTVAQGAKQAKARALAAAAAATAGSNTGIDADVEPEPKGDPIRLASGSSADNEGANVIRTGASSRKPQTVAMADPAAELTANAAAALASGPAEESAPAPLPDVRNLTARGETPAPAQAPAPVTAPQAAAPVLPVATSKDKGKVEENAQAAQADLLSPLPPLDPAVQPEAPATAKAAEPTPPPVAPVAQPEPKPAPVPDSTPAPVPIPIKLETISDPSPAPARIAAPIVAPAVPAAVADPAAEVPAAVTAEPAKAEAKSDLEATPAAATERDEELPPLPANIPESADPVVTRPTAIEPPAIEAKPAPAPAPAPAAEEIAAPVPVPATAAEPAPAPTPAPAPAPVTEPTVPEGESLPPLPAEAEATPTKPVEPAPVPVPVPVAAETPAPVPAPVPVAEQPPADPADAPPADPASSEKAPGGAPAPVHAEVMPLTTGGGIVTGLGIPQRANPSSRLSDEMRREVEQIARRQEEAARRKQIQPPPPAAGARSAVAPELGPGRNRDGTSDYGTQSQVDISRAPSPAEARPIRAIPVPDDYVPLSPRDWSPQRKYWSAAATCHMPLYFQDAALERYGHSAEQFLGPAGRFFAYPLDDPTQSTQRNQMLQPIFSVGLFAAQIVALPYNMLMDPPWEAEYDLGYYRPGDTVPTDVYYLPLHGVGPPLKGKSY